MVVSLVQIACTILSIMSAYVSLKWNQNVKGVDIHQIYNKLQERRYKQEILQRQKDKNTES